MSARARRGPGLPAALGIAIALATAQYAAAAERHLLVITGLGGEPEYAERFERWSATMIMAARDRLELPAGNVQWLSEREAPGTLRIDGRSDRPSVEAALARIAARSTPGDVVMVLLVGHGTARPGRVLFNLPGPDLSAAALGEALTALDGRTVVVVNASSASGPFVNALSAPGRVVATATASAAENQHTRFAGHFANAYAADAADVDKDGRVSVLEAFDYARREVRRDYQSERRLLTEHALIDDNGDGVGTRTPAENSTDGALARTVFLAPGGVERARDDPQRLALEEQARELVSRVQAHRRRKAGLTQVDYEATLESLLVELALNRRAIAAQGER